MIQLLEWLKNNPATTGALMSAVIAAGVGLITFAITQLLTSKRNRATLLLPKLEELYLLMSRISTENATICIEAFRAVDGDKQAQAKIRDMDHLDLYGHRSARAVIMLIRLYFPKLSRIHQMLFAAQRELNDRLFEVSVGENPEMPKLLEAAGLVPHFLKLMESEIVNNRDALVGDRIWPRRFKYSTDEELSNIPTPPSAPMWSASAKDNLADTL